METTALASSFPPPPPQGRFTAPQDAGVVDVLLLQLGTPTAPTPAGLRPYLRQFLMDGRVLEIPYPLRWLLVNGIIVPFRSPKSAAKYRRIWDAATGSPLRSITERQTEALQTALGPTFRVRHAMRYGQPSSDRVVKELSAAGCQRLVALPMYPQWSGTTTASSFDALFDALKQLRTMPALRLVRDYHDDPAYLDAVAAAVQRGHQQAVSAGTTPTMKVLSFHGIPVDYVKRGDPYMRQASRTGKLVAQRLGWKKNEWRLAYQSRLGRQKWLLPYFDQTVMALGREGHKNILVAQPGFTADCLETIDEIGHEGQEEFASTGGERLHRVPCLNDDPAFIAALAGLARRASADWVSKIRGTSGRPAG